jgi:hypothetical protein
MYFMEGQPEQGEAMQQQINIHEDFTYKPDLSDIPLGVSPLSLDYLTTLVETGLWNTLERREQDLIREYFKTNKSLKDLQPLARVRSNERVRQIISGSLTRAWYALPQQEKEKYPFDEIRKLKRSRAATNSPENNESRKKLAKQRWEAIYTNSEKWEEISAAIKRGCHKHREGSQK